MRAAVVGARGFVGRHVAAELAGRDWDVLLVDRARPGADVVHVAADLARTGAVGVVVNCAGAVVGNPGTLRRANAELPARLADVLPPDVALVHVGSAAEYGDTCGDRPCREDGPAAPVAPYGRSKLAGTTAVLGRGGRTVVVRPTTVIGPGCGGFVGALCEQVARAPERPVRVRTLDRARDFVDVRDVATAIALLAAGGPGAGGVVNVASGVATPLVDVVAAFRHVSGYAGPVEETAGDGPGPSGDLRAQCSDPALLRRALGWEPRRDLTTSVADAWRTACRRALGGAGR